MSAGATKYYGSREDHVTRSFMISAPHQILQVIKIK